MSDAKQYYWDIRYSPEMEASAHADKLGAARHPVSNEQSAVD